MEDLKRSYFNLLMLASIIREYWISNIEIESVLTHIDRDDIPFKSRLESFERSFELQNYAVKGFIVIQTCSFLDEYKFFCGIRVITEAEKVFRKKVMDTIKPPLKIIYKWKELYQVRNELLAHNWRKKGMPIMFSNTIGDNPQDIPWTDPEFTLLVGVFDTVIYTLKREFSDTFIEMFNLIKENRNKNSIHKPKVNTQEEAISKLTELRSMLNIIE